MRTVSKDNPCTEPMYGDAQNVQDARTACIAL